MPHVEINLQREIAEFYKNRKDIMKEVVCYSIRENEEEQNKIDKNINLLDEAWMEMEYQRYHKEYYMNFADNYGEKNLLEESDYVIFDLDEYSVDTLNGDGTRNWIYECELCNFKKKLLENKKRLKEALIESYISVGVSLALLR
jgi:superoxide dismutase